MDKILNVHHIESRKTGGDSPKNLITLCKNCHDQYHMGKINPNLKCREPLRDAAFMGIMRWSFYNRLKNEYLNVSMTYGYITKNKSIIQMPAVYQGIRRQNRLGITSVRRRYAAITGRFIKRIFKKAGSENGTRQRIS